MVVNKEFRARCRACKEWFSLYNYQGLHPDSLMGDHWCDKISMFMRNHPRAWKIFDKLIPKKKKKETDMFKLSHIITAKGSTPHNDPPENLMFKIARLRHERVVELKRLLDLKTSRRDYGANRISGRAAR